MLRLSERLPSLREMLGIMLGETGMLVAVQATPATVLGTVRDEITGEPIAGANVTLPDLQRGATTDEQGW